MQPDVIVVDHHDSYTWNLVHLVASVTGVLPRVVQHDEVTPEDVLRHSHVLLSPGPGHPAVPTDFSVGTAVLLDGSRPVLGVCLGMQGLVTTYGGVVSRLAPAHGDVAAIRHDGQGVFAGLPQDFAAVRYHSLGAISLGSSLLATAWSEDGVVMGVRHPSLPLEGVQFHPESILSSHGAELIRNFLNIPRRSSPLLRSSEQRRGEPE